MTQSIYSAVSLSLGIWVSIYVSMSLWQIWVCHWVVLISIACVVFSSGSSEITWLQISPRICDSALWAPNSVCGRDRLTKRGRICFLTPKIQGRLFFVITIKYKSINKCFAVFQVLVQSGGIAVKRVGVWHPAEWLGLHDTLYVLRCTHLLRSSLFKWPSSSELFLSFIFWFHTVSWI